MSNKLTFNCLAAEVYYSFLGSQICAEKKLGFPNQEIILEGVDISH